MRSFPHNENCLALNYSVCLKFENREEKFSNSNRLNSCRRKVLFWVVERQIDCCSVQVLPVFIQSLPLKEDIEESASVYGCLCNLIFTSQQDVRN